jgi:carboxyl-terminal processing protease
VEVGRPDAAAEPRTLPVRVIRRTIELRTPAARALVGILAAIVMLLAGIWLGGHPNDLPAPLRGRVFESRPAEPVFQQALRILSNRYFRPLETSSLVDLGLSGMVAGLDDPYSRYIDRASYEASKHEPAVPVTGIGIHTVAAGSPGHRRSRADRRSPADRYAVRSATPATRGCLPGLARRSERER